MKLSEWIFARLARHLHCDYWIALDLEKLAIELREKGE